MHTTSDRKSLDRETESPSSVPDRKGRAEVASALEPHVTVKQIADAWRLSEDTVHRIFENEPGVFVLSDSKRRAKRRYRTLRIPASVVERVHRQFLSAQHVHKE